MLGREETPAERAHGMFTLLGLRHLVVVNEASHVRGVITRRDLDHAAGHGSWRRNKIANGPDKPEPQGAHNHGLCRYFYDTRGPESGDLCSQHTACRQDFLQHRTWTCCLCPL